MRYSNRGAGNRSAANRVGLSMIEAMVGMMVLASTTVMISASLSSSQAQMSTGKRTTDATGVASQQLEWFANYPETLSLPAAMSVARYTTPFATSLYGTQSIVSIPTALDGTNSIVLPVQASLMSPTETEFSNNPDHDIEVRVAKVGRLAAPVRAGEDIRKYQFDVYQRTAGGGRAGLIYRSAMISSRLDPRSR